MVYHIDPVRDFELAEEFRKTPIGRHSPNLTRLLNVLRFDPSGYQTILIVRKPFHSWSLGTLPPDRAQPIVFNDELGTFTSREDAEWAVFCARWRKQTGHAINSPRSIPLIREKSC